MPYSKKAKFYHHRQKSPRLFDKKTFKNVPLNHTSYRGEKYSKWMYSGTPARAIVGKLKKSKKWSTQSILIPKDIQPKSKRNYDKIKKFNGKNYRLFRILHRKVDADGLKEHLKEKKKYKVRVIKKRFQYETDYLIYVRKIK